MARIKTIDRLTFRDIIIHPELYAGLVEGLTKLPVPSRIRIRRRWMPVPATLDEFCKQICYGQRLYLVEDEPNDTAITFRILTCYFFPLITGRKWDQDICLQIGKYLLPCRAKFIYPVAMHLITMLGALADREKSLLHREPSKMELAAGIEKLNIFGSLLSVDYLRDLMKISVPEVLLTPYKECLVRFMMAKAQADYLEQYTELLRSDIKTKQHEK
jgi:hypothetical protein